MSSLPVVETDEAISTHSEQDTAMQTLGREAYVQSALFAFPKVLVNLDGCSALADGIVVRVILAAPGKVERGAESFVPPGERSVDDVLAIAADGNETSIRRVLKRAGVDFARSQVLGWQRERLAVFCRFV